ncbi:MAG TPA: (Fe-S)-binding protein [Myxococcota bacterium]|nr:(Fe-S)-binding protein [Myxococcota bacterium]
MINAVVMSVLLAAALTWFTITMRRKIRVMLKGQPAVRWDQVPTRLWTMVKVAFGQSKLFKEPGPGLMHALIFWGFLLLLIRTISVFGRAYGGWDSNWTLFWFWPAAEHVYTFIKDIAEAVVLVMILWATWRRLVTRPERLTHSLGGFLVLGLIGTLMITDFLYDGARFAIAANPDQTVFSADLVAALKTEAAYSPVASMVATLLAGMAPQTLHILSWAMYWLHAVTLLFFLNELPLSKHFHVITSIPNVFLSRLEAPGAITPIKDIEEQEKFGVNEPRDLTWKQILDGYTCTECGRCTVTCPAHQTGKPLSPKMLICDMRDFIKANEDNIINDKDTVKEDAEKPDAAAGQYKLPPDQAGSLIDAIGEEVIWACTTCRSCEENCPVNITHTDKIVDYRRYLTLMEGSANPEVNTAMKNLENKSNPWGLSSGERGQWMVDELDVPLLSEKGEAEYLFYMGCSAAYEDRSKKVATAFIKLLQKAGVDFAILGNEEGCCGDSARRLGNEYLFQIQAQTNIEVFKAYNVKKIVTMCPHGYNTIRHEYPQFDGEFEVIHHTELLAQLVAEGKLTIPSNGEPLSVVFHDSCYLGRYNNIYDAPRQLLKGLPGIKLEHIEKEGKNGMCCGAGGGLMWREEHIGQRVNQLRVQQLTKPKPQMIASACPFCLVMCRDGVNELEMGDDVKTADIAEILASRIGV